MDLQIILLLCILFVAILLFSFEWVSADVVALGVLVTLILTRLLPAEQAFAGFGSDTVIMILGLLILTAALARTGVVEMVGRTILSRTGENPQRLLVVIIFSAAALGAIMSNTAATAFFLPIVIGISRRARLSPSKLLMPLAFATILSSSITLISTSTNIVVSGMITSYEMAPIQMFELAPVGLPIALVGLIYMLTLGRRIIPERSQAEELTGEFGLRPYLTEIVILPESPLIGKTLAQSRLGRDLDLTVLRIERGKQQYIAPQANLVLQENDVLLVEGIREQILKIKNTGGINIKADVKFSDPDLQVEDSRLVEAILMPRSPLIGRTLKRLHFRDRHGLQVLAINRHGETIRNKISEVVLRMGDVLLLQGHRSNIAALEGSRLLNVLGAVEENALHVRRAPLAIGIFIGAIAAGTINLIPFPVAVLLGALLAFVTRCITPEEAYREVEWKILILIGSMLAVGAAMENTGTAVFLSGQIVRLVGQAHPVWLLGAFFLLTVLLTQPMSNQAAAVVVVPVAIQTALQLGLNPRTFAVMIAVAASTSFLTPLEPACMIVYGPGRYRFMDFFKVGSLLTGIIFLIALLLVPSIWPFR
jgi:di/tricarboxylate transporter